MQQDIISPQIKELYQIRYNYETIRFFLEDNSSKQKVKKLKEIKKQDTNRAIDVFIAILNTHANHGNGVEEEAEKLLIEIYIFIKRTLRKWGNFGQIIMIFIVNIDMDVPF